MLHNEIVICFHNESAYEKTKIKPKKHATHTIHSMPKYYMEKWADKYALRKWEKMTEITISA